MATLGPASAEPATVDELLAAGVDVVRLNLSHGTLDEHLGRLELVRAAAERAGRIVGVLADLPGPKVRSGPFPEGGADWSPGTRVRLVAGEGPSSDAVLTVAQTGVLDGLVAGDRVVVGDGAISLRIVERAQGALVAEVVTGGWVQGRPGVHVPSARSGLRAPTEADLELARAVAAAGVDFVAVSFVRGADDLTAVRRAVAPHPVHLVAKIETAAAVEHLADVVDAADAVMVARGDLGIECALEDVPHLQKRIVRHCVEAGVPVITATQMLESMVHSSLPTRAEVSDVANAVFDGADALMLSAETAIGVDPVAAVRTMARIAERAEAEAGYAAWGSRLGRAQQRRLVEPTDPVTHAVTHAAWQAQVELELGAVLCCTRSGRTAQAMARFRPTTLLVGLSADPATVRHLALVWGVVPVRLGPSATTDELVEAAVARSRDAALVRRGQTVLVLAGAPDRPSHAATDLLRVVEVR